ERPRGLERSTRKPTALGRRLHEQRVNLRRRANAMLFAEDRKSLEPLTDEKRVARTGLFARSSERFGQATGPRECNGVTHEGGTLAGFHPLTPPRARNPSAGRAS